MSLTNEQIGIVYEKAKAFSEDNFRLKATDRQFINKKLDALCKKHYDQIPLDDISKILNERRLLLLQEDGTKWSGIFCGSKGRASFDVGNKIVRDERGFYIPYVNTVLILTWYRFEETGRYEIVAYLS